MDREFERRSNEDALVNAMADLNPLTACVGFTVEHIHPCTMHCVNLGTLQAHNGALIQLLCQHSPFLLILAQYFPNLLQVGF